MKTTNIIDSPQVLESVLLSTRVSQIADELRNLLTDDVAERARKLGATTLHSIGDVARHQRWQDNELDMLAPEEMLQQLCSDNRRLTAFLRITHEICDRHHDVATASLIEAWIDQAERRAWFLAEILSEFGTDRGPQ